jgi:hypothetical protein
MTSLLVAFLIAQAPQTQPYIDEQCLNSFSCALGNPDTYVVWELFYEGQMVKRPGEEDLTLEQCQAAATELNTNTPPFKEVVCRARLVERQGT